MGWVVPEPAAVPARIEPENYKEFYLIHSFKEVNGWDLDLISLQIYTKETRAGRCGRQLSALSSRSQTPKNPNSSRARLSSRSRSSPKL